MGYVFWCAACGNPDVIIESTKSGYSVKKGLVGAAILGPVGAVAGLDGKESNLYYCPKCGAKLNQCMPDYEVNSILQMLNNPDASRGMLEDKRKKYPNMLWPKKWAEDESAKGLVGEISSGGYTSSRLSEMTEYDFMDAIESVLKKAGCPVPADEIKKTIIGEREWDDVSLKYEGGEIKAESQGIYRSEKIEGVYYYIPPKDADEQRDFSYQYKARDGSKQYEDKGYFQEAVRLIQEEGPISVPAIMDKLIATFPDINSINPYSAEGCAAMAANYLVRIKKATVDEQGLYAPSSALEEERAFIEKYKKKIDEKTIDTITHRREKTVLRVLDYLENYPGATILDIERGTGVKKILVRGSLSRLQKNSEVESVGSGETAKWYKAEVPEAELKERAYKEVLEKERDNMSDLSPGDTFTLDDVRKVLREAEDYIAAEKIVDALPKANLWGNQPVYEALYILQVFGEAKNEEREGISYWCIVDERIERKKRIATYWEQHVDEYNSLLQEQKELKKKSKDANQRKEEALKKSKESRSRQEKESAEEGAYKELQNRISTLRQEQSSLGFFKGKEKKRIQEQIDELTKGEGQKKQAAEEARKRIDEAEQKIQNESDDLVKQVSTEIAEYNERLSEIEAELTRDR